MSHGNDKTSHSPEALTCLSAFVLCSHESITDHTCHSTLVSASLFKQRCFTGGPRLWFLQPFTFILHIPIKFPLFSLFSLFSPETLKAVTMIMMTPESNLSCVICPPVFPGTTKGSERQIPALFQETAIISVDN